MPQPIVGDDKSGHRWMSNGLEVGGSGSSTLVMALGRRVDKLKAGNYNINSGMGANGFDGDSEAEAACRDPIHLVKRWTQVSAEAQPLAA